MSGALKKTKKRKQKQKPTREDDIPPDLKLDIFQFSLSSYLTPIFQGLHIFYCSVQARRKWRWEEEREGGEKGWKAWEEAGDIDCVWKEKVLLSFFFQQHQFTELEVMTLWNSFKIDFPEDTINKIQLNELVTQLFPK